MSADGGKSALGADVVIHDRSCRSRFPAPQMNEGGRWKSAAFVDLLFVSSDEERLNVGHYGLATLLLMSSIFWLLSMAITSAAIEVPSIVIVTTSIRPKPEPVAGA